MSVESHRAQRHMNVMLTLKILNAGNEPQICKWVIIPNSGTPHRVKIQRLLGWWRISLETNILTASEPVMISVAFSYAGRIKDFDYAKVLKGKNRI